MSANAWLVLQIAVAMLCAAAAFGVVLSAMLVRGRLPVALPRALLPDAMLFDLAQTDRSYQLASILASVGAMMSLSHSLGAAAAFIGVAASFQLAEHWLLPRMRAGAAEGALPMRGARARLELVQAAALALIFVNLGIPPLATLANVYGLR